MADNERDRQYKWCDICGDAWRPEYDKPQPGKLGGYVEPTGNYVGEDFRLCPSCLEKIVLATDTSKIF